MVLRQHLHELELDLHRVLRVHKPQLPADALYMGIHYDAVLVVDISTDHVGGLPSHPRQGRKALKVRRNLPAVLLQQHLRTGDDVLCLVVIKARGVDVLLHLLKVCIGKVLKAPVLLIQGLCHLVDPGVGTLGAHDHRKEELPVRFIVQIAAVFPSIFPVQSLEDLFHPLGPLLFCFLIHKSPAGPPPFSSGS